MKRKPVTHSFAIPIKQAKKEAPVFVNVRIIDKDRWFSIRSFLRFFARAKNWYCKRFVGSLLPSLRAAAAAARVGLTVYNRLNELATAGSPAGRRPALTRRHSYCHL